MPGGSPARKIIAVKYSISLSLSLGKKKTYFDFKSFRCSLDDDLESPLYASPTVYGYAKIGEKRSQASKNQGDSTLASISQPADEFTFGHTGHMAIILGRYDCAIIIIILGRYDWTMILILLSLCVT